VQKVKFKIARKKWEISEFLNSFTVFTATKLQKKLITLLKGVSCRVKKRQNRDITIFHLNSICFSTWRNSMRACVSQWKNIKKRFLKVLQLRRSLLFNQFFLRLCVSKFYKTSKTFPVNCVKIRNGFRPYLNDFTHTLAMKQEKNPRWRNHDVLITTLF
jgi:hypothetical protein